MEPVSSVVGLTVGVASIASIFQTCLHGYRTLNTAIEIGSAAVTLNVQFRVEELRLYLWGRTWGLTIDLKSTKGGRDSSSDSNVDFEVQTSVTELDDIDNEYDIPGLRDLTIEVLGRISKALDDWRSVERRYSGSLIQPDSPEHAFKTIKDITSKQKERAEAIATRTKLSSKFRWALTDKTMLEGLLTKLTTLNDSLEKLLPKKEKTSVSRGLAGELLNVYETSKSTGVSLGDLSNFINLVNVENSKALKILQLKRLNQTEQDERVAEGRSPVKNVTPFAIASKWSIGEKEDLRIPATHFTKLVDPKLQYYHQEIKKSRWISSKYVPLPRTSVILAPPASVETDQVPSNITAQMTLIEWRPTAHESRASELSDVEMKERRDHIARLLHKTSVLDTDFRVLDCIGYVADIQGHTPDGNTQDLVGYVYRYPEFASTQKPPVTLRELIGTAYHSDDPNVPPLEERFRLAKSISIALYQLQCAGWVHRKISSYNIIFFYSSKSGEIDLTHPYLGGWQYSRPDDQRRLYPSERSSGGIGDLDMYVHRRRLFDWTLRIMPRFRKSFDIYSLGIILIEIAFWEPILSLAKEEDRARMEAFEDVGSDGLAAGWWETIEKVVNQELAAEMGCTYRDVVLFCLKGIGEQDKEKWKAIQERLPREPPNARNKDVYFEDEGYEEVGIEKEFYWNVIKEFDRISI